MESFYYSWFNYIIERFVSNVCLEGFDLIYISCDCSLNVSIIVQMFCDMGQYTHGLPIFLEKVDIVFLLPKALYVHISLDKLYFF
jgi:hypothetical protein